MISKHLIITSLMYFGIFMLGNSWKPSRVSRVVRGYSLSSYKNFSEIALNCQLTRIAPFDNSFRLEKSNTSFQVSVGRFLNSANGSSQFLQKFSKFLENFSFGYVLIIQLNFYFLQNLVFINKNKCPFVNKISRTAF